MEKFTPVIAPENVNEKEEATEEETLNIESEFMGLPTLFDQSSIAKILGVADSSCPVCGMTVNKLCVKKGHFPVRQLKDPLRDPLGPLEPTQQKSPGWS